MFSYSEYNSRLQTTKAIEFDIIVASFDLRWKCDNFLRMTMYPIVFKNYFLALFEKNVRMKAKAPMMYIMKYFILPWTLIKRGRYFITWHWRGIVFNGHEFKEAFG